MWIRCSAILLIISKKAYKLDENNRSVCLTFLEQAYYILGDQAGMNYVKERKDAE